MITTLSFNYGMKDKERAKACVKYGIIDTVITTLVLTVLFEIIAKPLSMLFSLSGGASAALVDVCAMATRIASLGYIFMGFTVAVQGVLQALRYAGKPLLLSFARLILFVFLIAYLFILSENVLNIVWWTFPIAEILSCIFAYIFLKNATKNKIDALAENI